jgi:hypothetical protein
LQAVYTRVWEDVGSDVTTGEAIAPLLATFGVVVGSDGQEILGALLFQDGDAEAGLLTLLDPPLTLPLSQVASDLPGTTFTPLLFSLSLVTGEQGLLTGTTIPLNRPGVAISRGSAAAGAYALVTSATDVFGNLGADLQSVNIVEPITP